MRVLRRLLGLLVWGSVLAGIAVVVVRRARAAAEPPQAPHAPVWPPFEPVAPHAEPVVAQVEPVAAEAEAVVAEAEPVVTTSWAAPIDGACPPGFPVKANDRSKIFHVPGGRSYERTIPERCYADPESAAADGYRAAKA